MLNMNPRSCMIWPCHFSCFILCHPPLNCPHFKLIGHIVGSRTFESALPRARSTLFLLPPHPQITPTQSFLSHRSFLVLQASEIPWQCSFRTLKIFKLFAKYIFSSPHCLCSSLLNAQCLPWAQNSLGSLKKEIERNNKLNG